MSESNPRALKRTRGGRERLLTAAAELFNANGLAATSLQMIADRLGVTKAALYYHFQSRDDIVRSLMKPVIDEADAAVRGFEEIALSDRPTAARAFYSDFVVSHRKVIHMVFFDQKAMPDHLSDQVEVLADAVAHGLAGSDQPEAVAGGTTLVYGVAALVARNEDLDGEHLRSLVNAVLNSSGR